MSSDAYYISKAFHVITERIARKGATEKLPNWHRAKPILLGQTCLPPDREDLAQVLYNLWEKSLTYYQQADLFLPRPDILHPGSHDNPDMLCITETQATTYKLRILTEKQHQRPGTWQAFDLYARTPPKQRPRLKQGYGEVPVRLLQTMPNVHMARAITLAVVITANRHLHGIYPRTLIALERDAVC